MLVFLTEEGGGGAGEIAFSGRFTVIWPKVTVDENCMNSGRVCERRADSTPLDYSGYSIAPIFD